MGAEDDAWRASIRNAKLERLRLLEIQQAQNGRTTDPAIVMEIASTRRDLGLAEQLVQAKASQEFAAEIGHEGQFLVVVQLVEQLGKRLELVVTTIGERIDRVEEHQAETAQRQDQERAHGQQRVRLVVFAIAVALLLLTSGVLYIAVTLKAHGL